MSTPLINPDPVGLGVAREMQEQLPLGESASSRDPEPQETTGQTLTSTSWPCAPTRPHSRR